jgi:fatty-acyl-CoA synthase
VSGAPNFAYSYGADRVSDEELEGLDLSTWLVALTGAEPVTAGAMDRFARRFGPCGLRPEALTPVYGLAEATLAVTFPALNRPPRVHDGHVSCGPPLPGTEIVIRGEDGEPVANGCDGEITVRGPGLTSGYVGVEPGSPLRDGWLFTGDRGRLVDGELLVTGRLKDLIIVDGVNVDPQEIDWAAESIVRIPGGRSAAFGIPVDGREAVVLAVEIDPRRANPFEAWHDAIRARVAALFGFRPHDLLFVRRGTIPKTSSGKVRRGALREGYLHDELDVVWRAPDLEGETSST